jgi:hypothetical protein
MTSTHPVRFRVEAPARLARIHVVIRLALLLAIASIGYSSVYWLLYLAGPALVALLVVQRGGERYRDETAPRVVRALRWLAGAYAYLWLLTDAPPTAEAGGPVELEVEPGPAPTATSALLRLVTSLPALLLAGLLSLAAGLFWIVGAISVLLVERLPPVITWFITLSLRYEAQLAAYHLSLVDRYPRLESPQPAEASAA